MAVAVAVALARKRKRSVSASKPRRRQARSACERTLEFDQVTFEPAPAAPRAPGPALTAARATGEWSCAAARALAERGRPLVVELELLFSCLVKRSVHFHDTVSACEPVSVTDDLQLCFRAVAATSCTMELAERLGRQPVTEIDTPTTRKLAPQRVWLDRVRDGWHA